MLKALYVLLSLAVSCLIAYATLTSQNSGNDAWYIKLLLGFSIVFFIISLAVGIVGLCNWLWGNKLKIVIHDTSSKSKVKKCGNIYVFDIAYALKTNNVPVEIARVLFHIQNKKLEAVEVPFKLDNSVQSHVSHFETGDTLNEPFKVGDKYYLSVFASGKEWQSEEFTLDSRSVEISIPTTQCKLKAGTIGVDVSSASEKPVIDKRSPQTEHD